MSKEPLRIELYLSTSMVFPKKPIHLDALLTYVVAKELFPFDADRGQKEERFVDIPLPLDKITFSKDRWIWKASAAFYQGLNEEITDIWAKRTYSEFSGYKASGIVFPSGVISDEPTKAKGTYVTLEKPTGPANDPASGGFKSYFSHRALKTVEKVIFHAVGNKQEVERLVEQLHGVGKKQAIGYGQIYKREVKPVKEDYSLLQPNGKPARYLPVQDFPDISSKKTASAYRPPYWGINHKEVCFTLPTTFPEWQEVEGKETDSLYANIEDDIFDDFEDE